ncbi:ArsC/Spx/MgsR family protein [uncultured Porphyromonas sp.]
MVHFIQENPSVLKRPIILNERNFQVGYDEEEIGDQGRD